MESVSEPPNRKKNVIPAKAGIQLFLYSDYRTGLNQKKNGFPLSGLLKKG
ncbi:hypothetical protein J7L05_08790 [bacterium]|nr:hypothetical protein [bacterium]